MVEGRLKYDQWEKDGQKHSRLGVIAQSVQFLGSPAKGAEFEAGAGTQSAPAQQVDNVGGGSQKQPPVSAGAPVPPVVKNGGAASTDPLTDDEDNLPF